MLLAGSGGSSHLFTFCPAPQKGATVGHKALPPVGNCIQLLWRLLNCIQILWRLTPTNTSQVNTGRPIYSLVQSPPRPRPGCKRSAGFPFLRPISLSPTTATIHQAVIIYCPQHNTPATPAILRQQQYSATTTTTRQFAFPVCCPISCFHAHGFAIRQAYPPAPR